MGVQSFPRRKLMTKRLLGIVVAVLLSTTLASAQGRPGACAADIKSKCGDVKPGEGRIAACVKEHLAELSQPCQARLAKLAEVAKACAADVKKSCGDVKPGRGRIEACLEKALGNLSDECKSAIIGSIAGRR